VMHVIFRVLNNGIQDDCIDLMLLRWHSLSHLSRVHVRQWGSAIIWRCPRWCIKTPHVKLSLVLRLLVLGWSTILIVLHGLIAILLLLSTILLLLSTILLLLSTILLLLLLLSTILGLPTIRLLAIALALCVVALLVLSVAAARYQLVCFLCQLVHETSVERRRRRADKSMWCTWNDHKDAGSFAHMHLGNMNSCTRSACLPG